MDAIIYNRRSKADPRNPGRSASVEQQEAECRAVCEANGWTVAHVLTDDGRSARRGSRARPEWEQVKRLIESGSVDVLVTWEASRAQRDLDEYAELRGLCADRGVLWSYGSRTYDMADSDDRFRTGLDALLSEDESEKISKRIRRHVRANAERGRPHGRRLYGYRRVYDQHTGALIGQEPEPAEAAIVVEVFERVAAGGAQRAISADLERRGVDPGTGTTWSGTRIRRLIRNHAYAGRRVHQGEVFGDADWPAIVTTTLWEQANRRIEPGAGGRAIPKAPVASLLGGVLRCGVCGGAMTAFRNRDTPNYTCARNFTDADGRHYGIGHNNVVMAKVNLLVDEAVAAYLERPDVAATITASGADDSATRAHLERVEELRRRLDDAAEAFATGDLSAAMLAKVERRLAGDLADAERAVAAVVLPSGVADALGGAYRDLPLIDRKEIIRAVVRPVVAKMKAGGRFQPQRLTLEWLV